jgi:hypothetical protein
VVAKIIALLEGLTTADLDATVPVHLERFSALCRHWASLADLRREVPNDGTLSDIKNGKRSE